MKTWEEIEVEFPNKWVVLKNVVFEGSDVIKAEVVDVKADEEIIEYQEQHLNEGYTFCRTTEGAINEPINASFAIRLD